MQLPHYKKELIEKSSNTLWVKCVKKFVDWPDFEVGKLYECKEWFLPGGNGGYIIKIPDGRRISVISELFVDHFLPLEDYRDKRLEDILS